MWQAEQVLRDRGQELEEKNRRLGETLRELRMLQADLVRQERRAAAAESISATTYEIERPFASISIYVEELQRVSSLRDSGKEPQLILYDMEPLLEKLQERLRSLEEILESIRAMRKRATGSG